MRGARLEGKAATGQNETLAEGRNQVVLDRLGAGGGSARVPAGRRKASGEERVTGQGWRAPRSHPTLCNPRLAVQKRKMNIRH